MMDGAVHVRRGLSRWSCRDAAAIGGQPCFQAPARSAAVIGAGALEKSP